MKTRIARLLTLALGALMLLTIGGCAGKNYDKVELSASWSYNYADVADLARNSDLIALVSIQEPEKDGSYKISSIRMTQFPAAVVERYYGEEEQEIKIVMTGGIDESEKKIYEIADDPLMKAEEEYLIFARKNEDGTYTILGGPQGRFVLEDGKVYSLNVANEQVKKADPNASFRVDGVEKADFLEEIAKAVQ